MSPDPVETGDAPVRAPELSGAVAWINVAQPLSLKALRGKVVLLDFWTYGCINCVHVLPDLKRLEAKYANELVVIGVHSGKFDNEKQTENLRRIVQRYDIHHPVANDADFRIWRAYTVRAWPTQVLIDPAGYVVGTASGEGHGEQLNLAIAAVIQVFDERGELDRRPLPQVIEQAPVVDGPLMFPGKVLADPAGGRLFIADSNHHRIVICTLPDAALSPRSPAPASAALRTHVGVVDPAGVQGERDARVSTAAETAPRGASASQSALRESARSESARPASAQPYARVLDVVGSGEAGRANGAFDRATFNKPQGLALAGDTLFVADTENHLIRAIDLAGRVVTDAAGTGRQARRRGDDGGSAAATDLNSPWDLVAYSPPPADQLGSAAAASASHGADENAARAASPGLLFIAMAGPHQIWMLDTRRGLIWPYAGSGREARLDGFVDDAAFAQPSGLTLAASTVMFVADSESNIIRAIDLPPVNRVRTLAGGDLFEFGDVDGVGDAVRFQHPLGVAYHDGVVYIADTYNHRIKQLDPQTGRVRTFAGSGRPGFEDGPASTAQFYEPGGLTATASHLYVADTNNHAIRMVDLHTGDVTTLKIDSAP